MAIVKSAEERREEILDAARALFWEKGYDSTSVTDIMKAVGIAKGTLYYHFASKEEIMNAIIERVTNNMVTVAEGIAKTTSIPVCQRIFLALTSFDLREKDGDEILEHIHKPQNALLHQKQMEACIEKMTPILASIIKEGITEGIFYTEYPEESIEMILVYSLVMFEDMESMEPSRIQRRIQAFVANLCKIFGAKESCFDFIRDMFTTI